MPWRIIGPALRGSGVAYDVRKAFPYSGYEQYEFNVPTRTEGDAFTLMTAEEAPDVTAIERFIGQEIERKKLDNFKYVYSLALDEKHKHTVGKAGNIRGGRAGKGYSFGVRKR